MHRRRNRPLLIMLAIALLGAGVVLAPSASADLRRRAPERRDLASLHAPSLDVRRLEVRRLEVRRLEVQSLDGRGNNRAHPTWGTVGTPYSRVGPARYADRRGAPVAGPNARYLSNRIFNDTHRNLFSERGATQWGFVWGQFLDHTFGLRDEAGEPATIAFDAGDPLEEFDNTLGHIPFVRSAAASASALRRGGGTGGRRAAREQVNTVSSYLDAWAVYGGTEQRLEWLREGPVDANLANNAASLLLPGGMLPRSDARGDAAAAPAMALDGRLRGRPAAAMVAGDVRANENIALTATHTLFAREHNRIVSQVPGWLTEEQKFQIARRVVIAEQQYITYHEFLPALGVTLPRYRGYRPGVNANLSNEFATVGYRAHSMIHGELEVETEASRYSPAQLEALRAHGVEVELSAEGTDVGLAIPLNVAFFNPDLVGAVQLGPLLRGIGNESQYNNDEMIDNQLRSVMFEVPVPGNVACLDGSDLPQCFRGVVDLGAIDVERGRDHGMPTYNQLRRSYGLAPKRSFTAITGEATEAFPADPELTPGAEIDDPDSLDFTALFDADGEQVESSAVTGVRRTTLAARLKAIYSSVGRVDAFTGMVSEPHLPGIELGELQLAIWQRQFQALRDGDRFFYLNDPGLSLIKRRLGIDFRHTLGDLIALNTDIERGELAGNVFRLPATQ